MGGTLRPSGRRVPRIGTPLLAAFLALLVLGPVAAGALTPSLGGGWYPSESKFRTGCASVAGRLPQFDLKSGVGRWSGRARSANCPPQSGNVSTTSMARAAASLVVLEPIKLSKSNTGVRVTWNLSVNVTTAAHLVGGVGSCPTPVNVSDANYGSTWINRTAWSQDCWVEARASISVSVALLDESTGALTLGASSWTGFSNVSGRLVSDSGYTVAYSNSSYWAYNYSSFFTANASWGPAGAATVSISPSWYLNGTFTSSDRYVLEVTLTNAVMAGTEGFPKASASVAINAKSAGFHEDLAAPVRY